MKKVLVVLVVVSLLVMPVLSSYAASEKMAFIDARRALYSYEKTKKFETEMNSITQGWQKEREIKVNDVKKLRDEVALLNGDAKAKKQLALEGKIADLNEADRAKRQEVLAKQNNMFRELTQDVNKVVEGIGKKGGYSFIFDSRSIVYKKDGLDLTEQVIEQLNK